MPNELTPARRGNPGAVPAVQGRGSATMVNGV